MVDQGDLAQRLLGTHVTHRAHQVAGPRQRGVGLAAGESEVGHPELAVAVQQQIGGLDVAMDDAVFVGRVQGPRRLNSQPHDRPKILAAARRPRGQERALDARAWKRGAGGEREKGRRRCDPPSPPFLPPLLPFSPAPLPASRNSVRARSNGCPSMNCIA